MARSINISPVIHWCFLKGYTGTWEMQGNYREIAITAKKTR